MTLFNQQERKTHDQKILLFLERREKIVYRKEGEDCPAIHVMNGADRLASSFQSSRLGKYRVRSGFDVSPAPPARAWCPRRQADLTDLPAFYLRERFLLKMRRHTWQKYGQVHR